MAQRPDLQPPRALGLRQLGYPSPEPHSPGAAQTRPSLCGDSTRGFALSWPRRCQLSASSRSQCPQPEPRPAELCAPALGSTPAQERSGHRHQSAAFHPSLQAQDLLLCPGKPRGAERPRALQAGCTAPSAAAAPVSPERWPAPRPDGQRAWGQEFRLGQRTAGQLHRGLGSDPCSVKETDKFFHLKLLLRSNILNETANLT